MDAGEPQAPSRPSSGWTFESVLEAIQAMAAERGHPPAAHENRSLAAAASRQFGSWGAAVEAAGYPRPTRGGRGRRAAANGAGFPRPTRGTLAAPTDRAGLAGELTPAVVAVPPAPPVEAALPWSLALTGAFDRDARLVRREAERLRRQAEALDQIAFGLDQLAAVPR
jgi:hypothetical protein